MIPEGVRAALLEAGGCVHTPEPWKVCSSCGRPVPPWVLSSQNEVSVFDWQAVLVDGSATERKDVFSIDNIPKDHMASLTVATTSPRAPVIRAVVDPTKGEQIHMFTRRFARFGFGGAGSTMSVVVLEVTPDPEKPDQKVQLYVHPHALILSTKEMYF